MLNIGVFVWVRRAAHIMVTLIPLSSFAASSVTLAWDPSPSPGVIGYRVYKGTASGTYDTTVDAGLATTNTVSSLTAGATYYFAVTAYDTIGLESDFSNEVSFTNTVPVVTNLPVITLMSPAAGSAYADPASVPLAASVNPNGNTIAKVQFFEGLNLLGEDATSPYAFTWNNVPPGTYSLSAKALYGSNSVTSGSVQVTVTNRIISSGGLIAAFGFEEGSGTVVGDTSGNANSGAITGATWTTAGRFGRALSFNGSSSAVLINDAPSLALANAATLEAWVYPTTVSGWREVLYKGDDLFYLEASTPVTQGPAMGIGTTASPALLSAPSPLPPNAWSHLAATCDGATMRLYINGVEVANKPQPASLGASTYPLSIGADTLHSSYFAGLIDEVRVYSRTLSVDEIRSDMNSAVAGGVPNSAPTLNTLPDLALNSDAGLTTVNLNGISSGGEAQTLTVTAASSNTALVPNPTVTYTSPNSTGSIRFAPAANAFGTALITVTVSDGDSFNGKVIRSFTVQVNDIPKLSTIPSQVGYSGIASAQIPFTLLDRDTPMASLSLSAASSVNTLIPNASIVFSGSGSNRFVGFTPAVGQVGEADVTISANDGKATASTTFHVTVLAQRPPANTAPAISAIPNQSTGEGIPTSPIAFTVSDAESAASNLLVWAESSNTVLVPTNNIAFSGTNGDRFCTILPATGQTGTVVITLVVSDGLATASTMFQLSVASGTIQVSLSKNGSGTVIASQNPALMQEGLTYSVTATPNTGQVFLGWSGSITSTQPTISFVLTRSLSLQANFKPLKLVTNGLGIIYPDLSKSRGLIVGRTYSVSAIPGTGQEFAGWSGISNTPNTSLRFVMTPEAILRADFVPSPFLPVQGRYVGLFYETDEVRHSRSGEFLCYVNGRGYYSGKLLLDGKAFGFSGRMGLACQSTNKILRRLDTPLTLELAVSSARNEVTGRVTDGSWNSPLSGHRVIFHTRTNPAPYAGQYTLRVPRPTLTAPVDMGDGWMLSVVYSNGLTVASGLLGDGTRMARATYISKDGMWPLYAPLYYGKGSLLSWLAFANRPADDVNGALSWIRTNMPLARYYPAGFTNECEVVGSRYVRPPVTNNIITLTRAEVGFTGGNLIKNFANEILIGQYNRVVNVSSNRLSMVFVPGNGLFRGAVIEPDTTLPHAFSGVVLQKQNAGYGLLIGTNKMSRVLLGP